MKFKLVVLAFLLLFGGSTVFAATYYLPHVAVGSYTQGSNSFGYSTTFVFFNNTTTNANVTLTLTGDNGSPMSVTIPELGTNSTFNIFLPQAATLIYETKISGDVRAGAATIETDTDIGVSGIYTLYDNSTAKFVTEVGVGNAGQMSEFVIPVQITANGAINTGLALFNPGASDSEVTLSLTDESGTSAGSTSVTLDAGAHKAFYINSGDFFSDVTSFTGKCTVSSSSPISATTLRQNSPSFDTYTSIPVIPTSSSQTSFTLAQFADGGGEAKYKTTFMLINLSSNSANVNITLRNDDGSEFPVTMTGDDTPDFSFDYTLGPGESKFVQTDGTGSATGPSGSGSAVITSDEPIGAAGLFTQYNGDGTFNTEAGVQDSPTFTDFTLPIVSKPLTDELGANIGSDTGIALYNPTSLAVEVTPTFLDQDGLRLVAAAPIVLEPHGHYANFFGGIFPDQGVTQGSFTVTGLEDGVAAMSLRSNLSPFGITSLPVIAGAAPGFEFPESGAGGTRTGVIVPITVTGTTNINKALNWGYRIGVPSTGWPTGTFGFGAAEAINTSGVVFTPYTSTVTNIYVAPGVYTVKVMGWIGTSTSDNGIWLTYTLPDAVTVTGHTDLPSFEIPNPPLYTVSGFISGVESISATGTKLVFVSTDSGSEQYTVYCDQVSGTYSQQFPPGTYTASIQIQGSESATGTVNTAVYNIGTVTVGDSDVVADFTLPDFAFLSGTASFTGDTPAEVTIRAADTSVSASLAPRNYIKYTNTTTAAVDSGTHPEQFANPSVWMAPETGFTGIYDMALADGGDYKLSLSYPVYDGAATTPSGTLTYTPSASEITLNGDGTLNFTNVPSSIQLVTLSGNFGSQIVGSHVIVVSTSLTGMPNATYRAETFSAGNPGTWTVRVPRGNYIVYIPAYGTPYVVP